MLLTAARHATHHPHHPSGAATVPVAAPRVGAPSGVPAPQDTRRPTTIAEMVGQASLIAQLKLVIRGSLLRAVPMSHVLVDGPPGYGKTTIAQVVARELGGNLHCLTGPMLRRPQDVVGVMLRLSQGDVLFLDEIHAAAKSVLEVLYGALEDRSVSLLLGSGADSRAHVAHLPMFVCVAATTAPGQLTEPFRARFGLHLTMAPYSLPELSQVVANAWKRKGVVFAPSEPLTIAQRCKGTPRIALHLSDRCLDWVACQGREVVAPGDCASALDAFGIDSSGWDEVDRRILLALTSVFAGRAIGVEALSQAVGLDRSALESREGPMVAAGLITRTARGRMALSPCYELVRQWVAA